MAYCTVADVQAEFKSIVFAAGQNVTDTTVTGFITQAGALINSHVGSRWVTPITGDSDSLALMKLYCVTLVADRIRAILANKQTTNIDANQNIKAMGMNTQDVIKELIKIRNGEVQLTGATLLNSEASFFSNNAASNQQFQFRKNTKQW